MPHQESSTGRHAHGADKQFALRAAPLLLLLLLSAAWPGDDGATPAPQEAELLQRCFNGQEPWEQHPASTFEAFLKGQVPRCGTQHAHCTPCQDTSQQLHHGPHSARHTLAGCTCTECGGRASACQGAGARRTTARSASSPPPRSPAWRRWRRSARRGQAYSPPPCTCRCRRTSQAPRWTRQRRRCSSSSTGALFLPPAAVVVTAAAWHGTCNDPWALHASNRGQAAHRVVCVCARACRRVEADGGACVLRLLLLGECVEGGAGGLLARLLPINALRNAALLGASTPLVAMVDVDLVPSAQLARLLDEDGAE